MGVKIKNPLNKKLWLEEGFILQRSEQDYILGQGAFSYRTKPDFQTLYHPDFFLNNKKPWIKASLLWKANQKSLFNFLFEESYLDRNKIFSKTDFQKTDINSNSLEHFFNNSKKPSFVLYQETFSQIQQAIHKGMFKKVVPAFSEKFIGRLNLLLLIQNLFKNTHFKSQGFLYGVWSKGRGVLGFTPEILFSLKDKKFSTMALAGTGSHPGPSLLKDHKELKEHNFVIKDIQESLNGLVKWKSKNTSEKIFYSLKHLHTQFTGELTQPFDFEKICKTLHPTSAISGYPKKPAMDWLKNQTYQKTRQYFGAPFGFFSSKREAFCLVALRALEWNEKESQIFSGGGWIKESLLQKEWQELYLKRQQVKSFFQ